MLIKLFIDQKLKFIFTNYYPFVVIFFYISFILAHPNFFNKDTFFLLGDFSFYFESKEFFLSGLSGYYPHANGGEGGYDQIRYSVDIILRFIQFSLNDFLKFPLWFINRLLLFIPAFFVVYSLFLFIFDKSKNKIVSLIIAIYISGTIFILQNVNIYIWLSIIGIIFFYKNIHEDYKSSSFKNIWIVALSSVLFFSQLRTVIFLNYLMLVYIAYLLFFNKINIKYLLKYNFFLILIIIFFNFITFYDYFETKDTLLITAENIDLKQTRLSFIDSYNFNIINPFYILRFLINTNNATNNLMGDFSTIHYLSFINFLIIGLSIFKNSKDYKYFLFIGFSFILILSFYGTSLIKFFLINLPGLWTLSSPYHIFLVGVPFISLVYAKGFENLISYNLRFKYFLITICTIILLIINSSVNVNYYMRDIIKERYNHLYLNIPKIFSNNFINVNEDYFQISKKIDIEKKILHLPIVEGHYFIQDDPQSLRFPLIFSFFHNLKIVYNTDYVFRNSKNSKDFYESIIFFNEKKFYEILKKENIKYIIINKNIFHIKSEFDNFYSPSINFLDLKKIMSNKNFLLYEIIYE